MVIRRYTFGSADLAGNSSNYDEVEGTIWGAVDGNYVVKYEAGFSGQHNNLTAGDITLLDEGTISTRYQLSDVNGDLTIEPPTGALSVDLGKLFFSLRQSVSQRNITTILLIHGIARTGSVRQRRRGNGRLR